MKGGILLKTYKKTIKLLEVSAEKAAQYFTAQLVNLNNPALALLEPLLSVSFDRVILFRDKAVVQGNIHKNIIYKDTEGFVRHQPENIPFSKEIDIPGFSPIVTLGKGNRVMLSNNVVNINLNNGVSTNQGYQNGIDVQIFVSNLLAEQILLSPQLIDQKIILDFIVKISKVTQEDMEFAKPSPVFEFRNIGN
jgi:hypothetical protein